MADFERLKRNNNDFEKEKDREILEKDLIAIGIFGLQDPLRPDIVESIKKCKAAGITVIMCTGDNIDTAIAISKNAGIVNTDQIEEGKQSDGQNYTCMTGKQFREACGGLIKQNEDGKEIDMVANMKKFK